MYWAHYNKNVKQWLPEHLQLVSRGCQSAVSEYINFRGIKAEQFEKLAMLCGKYHDLGKYTDFFQDYMIKGQNSPDQDHAHISALYVYNMLNGSADGRPDLNMIISFFCYLAVRLHHSNLRVHGLNTNPNDMTKSLLNKQKNLLQNAEKILKEFPEKCSRKDFEDYLSLGNTVLQNICDIPHYLKSARLKNAQWFFFLILLFSLLIDQDKLDSAQIAIKVRNQISPDRIPEYLVKKNKGKHLELNERRENARKEVIEVLSKMTEQEILDHRIYTLTAPTGIGKTLASLQAAAYLSHRLKGLGLKKLPKIITAIPFVNIIEQNLEDYQEICGEDVSLLAHYHLGQVEKHTDQHRSLENVLLETESWEADVIITTYVQLLQSLLSNRNRNLKKINKLAGSIVIMDEIQALPDEYMPLIGAVIRRLAAHYGTRFILMTATQPKIMQFADQLKDDIGMLQPSIELLPNNEAYFTNLRRTQFISLIEGRAINEDEFIEKFQAKYAGKGAALIVINTIKRSLNLYKKLSELYPRRVLYLSTNIIPIVRKKVIKRAKRYLKFKIPFILVSTQTIEAGVDLDFDMAFRDLAPLPSLIQTAGRVNRNNSKGSHLPIYITEIDNDCGFVYGTDQKNRVKAIFVDKRVIGEEEYRALVDDYYLILLKQGLPDESKQIWEKGIVELDFEYISKFELIKQSSEIVDVFVEYDEIATELADLYIDLRKQLRQADKEGYFAIKARLKLLWLQCSNISYLFGSRE